MRGSHRRPRALLQSQLRRQHPRSKPAQQPALQPGLTSAPTPTAATQPIPAPVKVLSCAMKAAFQWSVLFNRKHASGLLGKYESNSPAHRRSIVVYIHDIAA